MQRGGGQNLCGRMCRLKKKAFGLTKRGERTKSPVSADEGWIISSASQRQLIRRRNAGQKKSPGRSRFGERRRIEVWFQEKDSNHMGRNMERMSKGVGQPTCDKNEKKKTERSGSTRLLLRGCSCPSPRVDPFQEKKGTPAETRLGERRERNKMRRKKEGKIINRKKGRGVLRGKGCHGGPWALMKKQAKKKARGSGDRSRPKGGGARAVEAKKVEKGKGK